MLHAQKSVHHVVMNETIELIQINPENCFEVILDTGTEEYIEVDSRMDGEYSEDLQLTITESGTTLLMGAGFQPGFKKPNDKLSAHKVVSISLHIVLPAYKNVQVFGGSTRIVARGRFTNLDIVLSDGACELHSIVEMVNVRTQSGPIIVYAKDGQITAETKYGRLSENPIPKGDGIYQLKSVTGNIDLNKTE